MDHLQARVFEETEKLVGTFSVIRVLVYTIISALLIVVLLFAFSFPVDTFTVLFAVALSFVYSFARDFFVTRYSKKMMYSYYNYLLEKKPGIDLYIPLFQKTRQGIFLKKASLYFDKGELYLEAFNQQKSRKRPEDSISVKKGRDFALDQFNLDGNPNIVTYEARLMQTDLKFSLVNIKEVIDRIEQRKEE